MIEFSLNTEFENLQGDANRARATEKNGRNDNGTGKKHDESAKSPDFFQENSAIIINLFL